MQLETDNYNSAIANLERVETHAKQLIDRAQKRVAIAHTQFQCEHLNYTKTESCCAPPVKTCSDCGFVWTSNTRG